jgi:uncharacterized protein YbjT (DUF2867 family)
MLSMMAGKILVAGASGAIGQAVTRKLLADGHKVRTLSRDRKRAAGLAALGAETRIADAARHREIEGICDGVTAVVSCLGAPVSLRSPERRRFANVDTPANLALLEEAKRAGVKRFLYVSVHVGEGYSHTRYIRAHEEVVEAVHKSGLSSTVVRPTGVFAALLEMVPLARQGRLSLIGDGSAKTNPIHADDVAEVVVGALEDGPAEIACGGPDTFTRRELAEAVCRAVKQPAKLRSVPPGLARWMGRAAGFYSPRMGELFEFFVAVSTSDAVAPVRGTRRFEDFLSQSVSTG